MRPTALILPAFMLMAACAHDPAVLPARPTPAEIDAAALRLMQTEDVTGMALALIRDGEIVHVASYGARNVEQGLPLETDTVMYGASFTKTAVAYLVLQLVEEGLIDLDRPLSEYLGRPVPDYENYADLAGDDRWQRVTARHVLTHSTGFANFRWLEDDHTLRFHFEPGSRYGYSGEGFRLLQLVLEDGIGLDLEAEMQARLFRPLGLSRTSLQWRDDFATNYADGYREDGGLEAHRQRHRTDAAGSMDTTIEDQARLWAGMLQGEGLSEASRREMTRPQRPVFSAKQFPTLWDWQDARGPAISLSAGLGLVTYQGDEGLSWFKGGHDDGTGNFAVCQETTRDCLILMANSVRAELIYPELADYVLGDAALPLWWEYAHVD